MKRKDKGARDLPPAPGDLRLVQAFVNTADREAGTDDLASSRALADWLARHGLLPPGTELSEADRQRVTEVREGWRSMAAGTLSEADAAALDRATEAAALLRGRHVPGGGHPGGGPTSYVRIEPTAVGLDGALARLLAIILQAQNDGIWHRLKVCASPTCRALFYDRSSNHSARWCRPRCGNRLSSKASKRRMRRGRQTRMAKSREGAPAKIDYELPSLAELEDDPNVGYLARQLRELEEQE